jgi:hypothetical protein
VGRRHLALLLFLASACSSSHVLPPAEQDQGVDASTPTGPPNGSPCSFGATPVSFAIPATIGAPAGVFGQTTGQAACPGGGATFSFRLVDMDGDGLPDLLVEGACNDATVGTIAWLVYRNTGNAFAPTPLRYTLPQLSTTAGCTKWTLVDVDGDLAPDWVTTSFCTDATVGTSRWLVNHNTHSTFDPNATPFALPSGPTTGAFTSLEVDTAACAGGTNQPAYVFRDLDGDLKPDIVVTQSCSDPNVGTTHWAFYKSSGTGVATTAAPFALPATPQTSPGSFPLATVSQGACTSPATAPRYTVFDFNGDDKPDIMVTQSCTDTSVGWTQWLYYENSGTGFAPNPASVALPTLGGAPTTAFADLAASVACASTSTVQLGHATYDVNGDLKPDLIVTRSCQDQTVGVSQWDVYLNTGTGFGADTPYALPTTALGATQAAPVDLNGSLACAAGAGSSAFASGYFVSPQLDLVVTAECSDTSVGSTRWVVFPAGCQ